MERKTSLLLVEDSRLLRDALTMLLRGVAGFRTVATVSDAPAAVHTTRELRPDVALVDADVDGRESSRLVAALKAVAPAMRIIVLDLCPAREDVLALMMAGASGFVLRNASIDDLVRAIRAVAHGERVLPPSLAAALFDQIAERAAHGRWVASDGCRLTERESEVVALIREGLSNKQISERLHITTCTVKSHVHNVLEKLTLRSRYQIATCASGRPDRVPP